MTQSFERWAELSDRVELGEELAAEDGAFLAEFGSADAVASAEAQLFASMADFGSDVASAEDLAAADSAVARALSERRPVRSLRTLVWAGAGVLAAAAAVAILVTGQRPAVVGVSVAELVQAEARANGAALERGAHLAEGTEVVAVGGPTCIAVEPRIHACLAAGSRLKLTHVGSKERRVDLLDGRIAVALAPLPRGERFSVVANGTWSTAVGTAFSVELGPDGAVTTIVHEGKVAVGAERGGSVIGAHKIGLAHGSDVQAASLEDHTRTETPEWAALATVAQRSIEPPADVAAVVVPVTPSSEPAPVAPSAPPSVQAVRAVARVAVATAVAPVADVAPAASASELLALARQALREQRWGDAATEYRKLVAAYPGSPEARTVVVPLAKLEVDRLGQPARALPVLESYIASGGSLVVEARSARIRALRALGRTSEEAQAIDEFLAAHPGSLEADKLRARLSTLRPH